MYGAIKTDDQVVEKFVVQYKDGERHVFTAQNNTFIGEFPEHLSPDLMMFQDEIENVIGYDADGNVIERYS